MLTREKIFSMISAGREAAAETAGEAVVAAVGLLVVAAVAGLAAVAVAVARLAVAAESCVAAVAGLAAGDLVALLLFMFLLSGGSRNFLLFAEVKTAS